MRTKSLAVGILLAGLLLSGCATSKLPVSQALRETPKSAWALGGASDELAIEVSPAGRTIKMIPRVGGVLGTTVDAVVNDKYRVAVRDALGDYKLGEVFVAKLEKRLKESLPESLTHIGPLTSTAGFQTRKEAQTARLERLAKSGVGVLLDLDVDYGLYEADFQMRMWLAGSATETSGRRVLWRNTIPLTLGPLMADYRFTNLIDKKLSGLTDPQMAVEKDAVVKLTSGDAALLKQQFEQLADGAVSALMCDLGLADEALGHYYLGRKAFQEKEFGEASTQFVRALELDPGNKDIANDLSVTYARGGDIKKAIETAANILATDPAYGPVHYNLAWWYAFDEKDVEKARTHYEKAKAAGVPPSEKLDEALGDEAGK